ncbi:hypothetical protein J5X84_24260 [Streptosporangiaceae bacterium NEAU-GS5]|nr:hypothetical protein [Streptosporangiaceae bacterium NEAU-GS5]
MDPLSTKLTVLIGATLPAPAPPRLVESIRRVQVTTSDSARPGFQIVVADGRSGPGGLVDYPLLMDGSLDPFNRVILIVTFRGTPHILIDGVITHRELTPAAAPGGSDITVTGEDLTVMMDLEERSAEYPASDEAAIVEQVILGYARYGITPSVVPPPTLDPPLPIDRIPGQQTTDLAFLRILARRFGYVFHLTPGPAPATSVAYWGPPVRAGVPARALSAGPGVEANVTGLSFRQDVLTPFQVSGSILDRLTNAELPVHSLPGLRVPLAAEADDLPGTGHPRTRQFRESGLSATQALARAQGMADGAGDSLTVTGNVDTERYGDVLTARGLVGLRGAGWRHDGLYAVKRVTHTFTRGRYTQSFTLSREGVGSTVPAVRP